MKFPPSLSLSLLPGRGFAKGRLKRNRTSGRNSSSLFGGVSLHLSVACGESLSSPPSRARRSYFDGSRRLIKAGNNWVREEEGEGEGERGPLQ